MIPFRRKHVTAGLQLKYTFSVAQIGAIVDEALTPAVLRG
jgi:hypothetical protein